MEQRLIDRVVFAFIGLVSGGAISFILYFYLFDIEGGYWIPGVAACCFMVYGFWKGNAMVEVVQKLWDWFGRD